MHIVSIEIETFFLDGQTDKPNGCGEDCHIELLAPRECQSDAELFAGILLSNMN